METQSAQTKKFILNYGLIFGLISVILGVVMYVTNSYLAPHWSYGLIGFFVMALLISLGIKAFKKDNGGFLSLSEALKVGVGIALIGGLIAGLWTLVLQEVLEPDYMEQMARVQQEQMLERFPDMPQEQIDQTLEMTASFQSPWITIPMSLVVNLFLGLIISLIAGLVMRQKRPYEV